MSRSPKQTQKQGGLYDRLFIVTKQKLAKVVEIMGDLSKNFSRSELACKCGCGFGLGRNDLHIDLIAMLQRIRDFTASQ